MQTDRFENRITEQTAQKWQSNVLVQIVLVASRFMQAIALCGQKMPKVVEQTSHHRFWRFASQLGQMCCLQSMFELTDRLAPILGVTTGFQQTTDFIKCQGHGDVQWILVRYC
jgi:hypothetical protein